jgi:hypothetical protein
LNRHPPQPVFLWVHLYDPRGSHLFAYSMKDTVVKWLGPKPITHRKASPHAIDFKGYLVGQH